MWSGLSHSACLDTLPLRPADTGPRIDQVGQLMVIAGNLGLNQRPHLLPELGWRSSGRGGKYVLHLLVLVLDGSADKTHNKNQFMH